MWAVCSSTIVAELNSTSTLHRTASLWLFNPYLAIRTLFELNSFGELFKLLIMLSNVILGSVLSAGHPIVKFTSALQTVAFLADWAGILLQIIFGCENCSAGRGWTPTYFVSIPLCIQLKTEFLKLGLQATVDVVLNIFHFHLFATSCRTRNIKFSVVNECLDVVSNALFMKNVLTLQSSDILVFDYLCADLACHILFVILQI